MTDLKKQDFPDFFRAVIGRDMTSLEELAFKRACATPMLPRLATDVLAGVAADLVIVDEVCDA